MTELLPVEPLHRLRERRSAKWRAYGPEVLPLTIAEMDFALPDAVRDVLADAVGRSDTGYAMPTDGLGEALAGFAERRWGWRLDPTAVTATTDVSAGVVEMLRLFTNPGDRVVINTPVYPPFFDWLDEARTELHEVPLTHTDQDGWRLDLPALDRAFATKPAAFVLCNPQNPVGRVHTPEDLAAVVELATRHGVPVISDEIHAPLALPGATFTPFLSVPGAAEIGVAVVSGSKAFNLAALKCAMVVTGSQRMRDVVAKLPPDTPWRTGHFGVLATTAAYTHGDQWLDRLLVTLDDRRTLLAKLVRDRLPAVSWRPPQATYLAWLDCRSLGSGTEPRDLFLGAGVALEPGTRFGEHSGYVRLNFGTSVEVLELAVDRMASAL
ncbi:MalY/PatB family protein [Kutzneria kofuensis]|uniref:cysteine-S-conjugate beta-lyase n=1 Tax=Kutzneria kofuensis TaxID=103725 RepID=A0A7W9NE95_9PSEU|nr:aminotransferase class I/II-fold pyridoxal phosphate-dependent enzyme [Kutzneria kofuensis]MBB5889164.1 cystathionine beta-lyase [Kutzneria kofuensis]